MILKVLLVLSMVTLSAEHLAAENYASKFDIYEAETEEEEEAGVDIDEPEPGQSVNDQPAVIDTIPHPKVAPSPLAAASEDASAGVDTDKLDSASIRANFYDIDRRKTFFFDGVFAPSFGQLALQTNGDVHYPALKFGIQFARIADYFSLSLGFQAVGIGGKESFEGFMAEAQFFPAFALHLAISTMEGHGRVKRTGANNQLPQYYSIYARPIQFDLMYRFWDKTALVLGASINNDVKKPEYVDPADVDTINKFDGTTILFGIRGSNI